MGLLKVKTLPVNEIAILSANRLTIAGDSQIWLNTSVCNNLKCRLTIRLPKVSIDAEYVFLRKFFEAHEQSKSRFGTDELYS